MLIGTDVYKHAVALEQAINLLVTWGERLPEDEQREKLAGVTKALSECFVEMGFADVIAAAQAESIAATATHEDSVGVTPGEKVVLDELHTEASMEMRMQAALGALPIQEE